jgi:hypothetical protein
MKPPKTPTLAQLRRRFPEWEIVEYRHGGMNRIDATSRSGDGKSITLWSGSRAEQRRILWAALEAWEKEAK